VQATQAKQRETSGVETDMNPDMPGVLQNRISKTLLTLLILLKNLSNPAFHFFTDINFLSKVSKVFEILFCMQDAFEADGAE